MVRRAKRKGKGSEEGMMVGGWVGVGEGSLADVMGWDSFGGGEGGRGDMGGERGWGRRGWRYWLGAGGGLVTPGMEM